jgi:hypothetical protein
MDESETIDAESIIEQSGPEDKSVPVIDDGLDHEEILDEADEFGDIDEDDGMTIQDIDEVEEIKEEA